MATDTTNIPSETANATVAHDGDVERATLTQGATQIQVPAGENVVRVQVTPGETIQLPFATGGMIARLDDGNGNLAVKVGDITVILQGYIAATGEAEVSLLDSNGQPVDVAAVVAATDPNLDIQTAAGPGAGDQGTGADNNGGVFAPFDPANGIGGLNAVGGLGATELQYGLIERQAIVFEEEEAVEEPDTVPVLVTLTPGDVVNEDDFERQEASIAKVLEPFPSHIRDDLNDFLGSNSSASWGHAEEQGNDPFDTDDHEDGSQDGYSDDANGVDQDREPLTSTAIASVNFFGDVPGHLSFSDGVDTPILQQLQAMGLTSHSNELQYAVLPGAPDTDPDPNIDNGYGETLVAYYVETVGEGEQTFSFATIVFTIAFREFQGTDPISDFNIDFTIYGPIDNVPGIADADGDILDALDIDVPFFMVDSDGSTVQVPDGTLIFTDIDDVPSLGLLNHEWVEIGEGEGAYLPVGVEPTDTDIVHDETKGTQGGTDDVDPANYPGTFFVPRALEAANLVGATPIGAAITHLGVSFGADGRAGVYDSGSNAYVGNKEAGETVFTGDKGTYAQAYQLYIGAADAPLNDGTTNWTVTLGGEVVDVLARQVDANTIVGYALDDQQAEVPVFVLYLEPQSGELVLVQLHQINHGDPVAAPSFFNESNEASPSLLVEGQPVSFRATDYDGDHVDAPLSVTTLDDAPEFVGAQYQIYVDEDFLSNGNEDADGTSGDKDGNTKATGSIAVNFGTDQPGSFEVEIDAADFAGLQTVAGKNVLLSVLADQVIGYADLDGNGELDPSEAVDGNRVFVFEVHAVNAASAGFSLEIFQPLKHDNPEGVDSVETSIPLGFYVKAIDADGDSIRMKANFLVNDDAPMIATVEDHSVIIRLDESKGVDATDPSTAPEEDDTASPGAIGQSKGNIGSFFENIAFGADGPMGGVNNPDYALVLRNTDGSTAVIGSTQVATNLQVTDPGNVYANDTIFLVAISAYQINGYLHYEGPDSPNNILALSIQVDASWGEVTVTQYLPIAHDVDGASPADHDDITSLTVDAAGGIFAAATVTDGDGDKVTAVSDSPVTFVIEDDGPKLISVVHDDEGGAPGPFLIDEDALGGGNADGPGDGDGGNSVAYQVNVDFGTDGGGAQAFAFISALPSVPLTTLDGQLVALVLLPAEFMGLPAGTVVGFTGMLTDPANWVFTATIDPATGAGEFTLLKPVYHPQTDDLLTKGMETAFEDNITLTLTVRAKDGDGDWVDADIVIDIDDDSPLAANVTYPDPVAEGGDPVYLWTVADFIAANVDGGADGYKAGSLAFGPGSLGGALAIVDDGGVLKIQYTPPANVVGNKDIAANEDFTYSVKDKDNDQVTATVTVKVADGAAPALTDATGEVDEEGLANGLAGTVYGDGSDIAGQSKTTGGTLSVTLGTDPLAADNEFNLTEVNNLNGLMTLDGTLVALSGPATSGDAANTILTYTGYKTGGDAGNAADQVFVLTLNRDTGQWDFELKQPVKHPTADTEDNLTIEFGVSVSDTDGSTGTGKISVLIDDDSPDAKNDFDNVENLQTTDGNVIIGVGTTDPAAGKDSPGADGAAAVSAIASVNAPASVPTPTSDGVHGDGFVVAGEFGTLTIYADGYYSYTRSNGNPLVDSDVFTYTLKDGDTDTDAANLTIYIYDQGTELDLNPTGEDAQQVDEKGLPTRTINAVIEPAGTGEAADGDGTDNDDKSEETTGTMSFAAPDGLDKVTIQGKDGPVTVTLGAVVHGAHGDLTVTAFTVDSGGNGSIGYTYVLKDNADHSGGAVEDSFAVVVKDADGDQSNGTLDINIVDDAPDAKSDFDSVENFQSTDGNVITGAGTNDPAAGKDSSGADGATVSAIASVNAPASVPTPTSDGVHGSGFIVQGEFGALTIYADGHYSYTRSNGDPLVDSDVFTYTLKDGDTDTDTANLTIDIYDEGTELDLNPTGEDARQVDEKGLPIRTINAVIEPAGTGEAADGDGTDNDDKSEVTTGTMSFGTPDGFGSLTIQGKDGPITISNGSTVQGLYGTLEVTAFDGAGGTLSYTYTLKDNADHKNGAIEDSFAVVVKDADGDQSNGTLDINILDDAPDADDDNGGNVNAGNKIEIKDAALGVLANDDFGADGGKTGGGLIGVKTGNNSGESTTNVGGTLESALGFLKLNADGTYTYTAKTNASGTDYFTYTIEDGDSDRSTAVLSINVADQAEGAISGSTAVYEDGIADQHTGGDTPATQSLGITFTPADNEVLESLTLKLVPTGWKIFYDGTLAFTGTGANIVIPMSTYPDITKLAILPPADNLDGDLSLGLDASLRDPNGNLTSTVSGTLTVTRDAVADKPTNVEIIVKDSIDANSSFALGETGTLQVKASFADNDGSEAHSVTVTLHPGFTAAISAPSLPAGVTHTYDAATGKVVFTLPSSMTSFDYTFNITAPASGSLSGTLNFGAVAKAEETTLSGSEITTANNVATTEATTGIPASRLLDGVFKTNTNVNNQQLILTFVDRNNPLMAVAQVYSLNLQGQQGNFVTDAGFDINKDHQFLVGLEVAVNPKVIVTEMSLENVVLHSSGNLALQIDDKNGGGSDPTAFTWIMQPDVPAPQQSSTASTDGEGTDDKLTDATPLQFNYLFGATGIDTLTGGEGADALNGGGGKDQMKGEGGNDILVYDSLDTLIDGGTGFDILRIDEGAITNTKHQDGSLAGPAGLEAVSLSGNIAIKNIESILITTEAVSDGNVGTKLTLNAADVLNFTDNVKDANEATAHSLYIVGASGDKVDIDGTFNADGTPNASIWNYAGDVVRDGGMVFAQYNTTVSGTNVTLYVDKDVGVI